MKISGRTHRKCRFGTSRRRASVVSYDSGYIRCLPDDDRNPLSETHLITSSPLGKLRGILCESSDMDLPDSRHLDFRTVPHLPAAFSDECRNGLLKTSDNCGAIRILRRLLSESFDLARPGGRRLAFRMILHSPALFSEKDRNHLLKTNQITAVPLGKLRAILSESGGFALPDGMNLNFRTTSHLSDYVSMRG